MIDFQPITAKQRELYTQYFWDGKERGAEMSLVNLFLWGDQRYTILDGQFVVFSNFYGKCSYSYPVGAGDKKAVIDRLMEDAKERGIPFTLMGLYEEEKAVLEQLYPDVFEFASPESFYDYVYLIDDLADLAGKKYHRKRNHFRRFASSYNYQARPIESGDIPRLKTFVHQWYESRAEEDVDFDMEMIAVGRVFDEYDSLGMYGLLLEVDGEIVAFTMANRFSPDTMDVNFEKAKRLDGAYAAINCEFANYIRREIPEIRYMNREEDMGLEGLRKAKENYFPHHRVVKYRARRKTGEL